MLLLVILVAIGLAGFGFYKLHTAGSTTTVTSPALNLASTFVTDVETGAEDAIKSVETTVIP